MKLHSYCHLEMNRDIVLLLLGITAGLVECAKSSLLMGRVQLEQFGSMVRAEL